MKEKKKFNLIKDLDGFFNSIQLVELVISNNEYVFPNYVIFNKIIN